MYSNHLRDAQNQWHQEQNENEYTGNHSRLYETDKDIPIRDMKPAPRLRRLVASVINAAVMSSMVK